MAHRDRMTVPTWVTRALQAEPVAGINGASATILGALLALLYGVVPVPLTDRTYIAGALVIAERGVMVLLVRWKVVSPKTAAGITKIDPTEPPVSLDSIVAGVGERLVTELDQRFPQAAPLIAEVTPVVEDIAAGNIVGAQQAALAAAAPTTPPAP